MKENREVLPTPARSYFPKTSISSKTYPDIDQHITQMAKEPPLISPHLPGPKFDISVASVPADAREKCDRRQSYSQGWL